MADFKHKTHWEVTELNDLVQFFYLLPETLEPGYTFAFEGVEIGKPARALYKRYEVEPKLEVRPDTLLPKPEQFHVPPTPAFIQELQGLLRTSPIASCFSHVKAYNDAYLVLWAHDADAGGSVCLDIDITEEKVKRFAGALNSPYEQEIHLTESELNEQIRRFAEWADKQLALHRPWWKRWLGIK